MDFAGCHGFRAMGQRGALAQQWRGVRGAFLTRLLYCACQNMLTQKVFARGLGWNLFSLLTSKALAAALRTTLASQNACGCVHEGKGGNHVYDEKYDVWCNV